MAVTVTDPRKIPYLAVWAARNGYQAPLYSGLTGSVTVPGATDSVVSAQLSGIVSVTDLGVLMAAKEVETLPAGLSTTLSDAKTQGKATVNTIAQSVLAYLVSEDELSDANLGHRLSVYREIAQGGGTADEKTAIDAEITAAGSGSTRMVYAQAQLDAWADARTAQFKVTGKVKALLPLIDAEGTTAGIYTQIDALKTYITAELLTYTPIAQGAL